MNVNKIRAVMAVTLVVRIVNAEIIMESQFVHARLVLLEVLQIAGQSVLHHLNVLSIRHVLTRNVLTHVLQIFVEQMLIAV